MVSNVFLFPTADKQVFSDLDFLGWYTTGAIPTEKHINIHKQICQINECPIMLLLDPTSRNMNQLPISLHESIIDIVQGDAVMLFVPLTYTLATEEAERIGVDHVARMSTNDTDENSAVAEHLLAQHSAIKMLHSRVKIVLAYIKAVESGQLEANQEILRGAYSLSRRLPVIQNPAFKEEFYTVSGIERDWWSWLVLLEILLLPAIERCRPDHLPGSFDQGFQRHEPAGEQVQRSVRSPGHGPTNARTILLGLFKVNHKHATLICYLYSNNPPRDRARARPGDI